MIKKNILTVVGIILSFAIAIGGWAVTSRLIDIESDRLLSGTTSFSVSIPTVGPVNPDENNDDIIIGLGFTEDEMVSILQNWELIEDRRPHEPAAGQINMETAIISGRAGIVFLQQHNILTEGMSEFNRTGAFLSQNIPRGEEFLHLRYSYWTVSFHNEHVSIVMTINAVTGQIWDISISLNQHQAAIYTPFVIAPPSLERSLFPSPFLQVGYDDIVNMLIAFMYSLDIYPVDGTMHGLLYIDGFDNGWYIAGQADDDRYRAAWMRRHFQNGLLVGQYFADENARVEITMDGMIMPDGMVLFHRLNIKLTASPLTPWHFE